MKEPPQISQCTRNQDKGTLRSAEYQRVKERSPPRNQRKKTHCLLKLVISINRDLWDIAYKVVNRKLVSHRPPYFLEMLKMKEIMQVIFPVHCMRGDVVDERRSTEGCSLSNGSGKGGVVHQERKTASEVLKTIKPDMLLSA